eukprot:8866955-Ditylum_brightwellii.AAC.1
MRMNDASVHAIHFCSKSYMEAFVRRNTELARLVRAACLDPVRADKTTTEVLSPEVKGFSDVDPSN